MHYNAAAYGSVSLWNSCGAALQLCIEKKAQIKAYTTIEAFFCKINFTDGTIEKEVVTFMSTISTPIKEKLDINNLIDNSITKLDEEIETFTNMGSNWILQEIKTLIVKPVATE